MKRKETQTQTQNKLGTKSVLPECLQDKKHKEKTIDMENKGNTDYKTSKERKTNVQDPK
jgi:hypothetical protein